MAYNHLHLVYANPSMQSQGKFLSIDSIFSQWDIYYVISKSRATKELGNNMGRELPFAFDMPLSVFEKADAPKGRRRRIGGIASLETQDRQGETILQRGLDFQDFLKNGWFNDNHSKKTAGILGYPENTKYFAKGDQLPDGNTAPANGHWVEGYLLNTPAATEIWDLAQDLATTHRRLGFSVEGKVVRRATDSKVIAKALVRNVAITNCPVQTGAKMEILAKSLQVMEDADADSVEKALGMGTPTPGVAVTGEHTGEGAGQVLAQQSLEGSPNKKKKKKKKKSCMKSLSYNEATAWVRARLPEANPDQVRRVIALAKALGSHDEESQKV